jgi:elongation factor G
MSRRCPRRAGLLEPILAVEIAVPTEAMAKATALVTGRRGQLLGYDARPGWDGWDLLNAMIPEAEIGEAHRRCSLRPTSASAPFSNRSTTCRTCRRPADQVLTIQKARAAHPIRSGMAATVP